MLTTGRTNAQLENQINKTVDGIATVRNASTLLDSLFFTSTYSQAIFDVIASLQKYGYQAGNYSDLSAAVTAASTDTALLIVSERHNITTNTTISGQMALFVNPNGRFNITLGDTLTINVPTVPVTWQIFEGAGEVKFGDGMIEHVFAEMFGAKRDNVTDDYTAIQNAIESVYRIGDTGALGTGVAGGVVQLLEGVYRTSQPIFVLGHVRLRGQGRFTTQIRTLTGSTDITVLHNVDLTGGASPDTASQNYAMASDLYVVGTDTASATKPTIIWGGSFTKLWNMNIQSGDVNLMYHSGTDSYFEELQLLSPATSNVYIPDSLNSQAVSAVQVTFKNIKAIGAGTYGFLLEGDFQQGGGGGGNRIYLDHVEISQCGQIGVFADHMGELFIYDTDISASDVHTGIKIWESWKPRINACETELASNANRTSINGGPVVIGYHLLDQTGAFMNQNVASVSDTGGVGLFIENGGENIISDMHALGDTIGVWLRGTSHNKLDNIKVSNVDPVRGGFCFLEEASSAYNKADGCFAKTLIDADIVGFQLSNNSNWQNCFISADAGGNVTNIFDTGPGRVITLTDGDTTPLVDNGSTYLANNTSLTTYTDFDGEFGFGKIITIFHQNANSRYDVTGTNLEHPLGIDFTAPANSVIQWFKTNTDVNWICIQEDWWGNGTDALLRSLRRFDSSVKASLCLSVNCVVASPIIFLSILQIIHQSTFW